MLRRASGRNCFHAAGKFPFNMLFTLASFLSVRSNGHFFPGGPGLAGTRMSSFWILFELRVMEVVVTTGTIRHAKLQSNCYHERTNTKLQTRWMPSTNQPTSSVEALKCYYTGRFVVNKVGLTNQVSSWRHIGPVCQSDVVTERAASVNSA